MDDAAWAALPEHLDEVRLADVLTAMGMATKPGTLRKWRQRGGGPPWWRVMGRTYYRRDSVRGWLEAQERKAATTRPRRDNDTAGAAGEKG